MTDVFTVWNSHITPNPLSLFKIYSTHNKTGLLCKPG